MIGCYPEADIHAVVDFLPDADRAFLGGKHPTTTTSVRLIKRINPIGYR
jgi:hypothetical protein